MAKGQTQEKAPPPTEKPEETKREETNNTKPKKNWSFKFGGELTNYFISESSAFFSDRSRHWLETSLRLDGTVNHKNFTAGISALAIKTTGQDSYGTGTLPAGSPQAQGRQAHFPVSILTRRTSNSTASPAFRSRPPSADSTSPLVRSFSSATESMTDFLRRRGKASFTARAKASTRSESSGM